MPQTLINYMKIEFYNFPQVLFLGRFQKIINFMKLIVNYINTSSISKLDILRFLNLKSKIY